MIYRVVITSGTSLFAPPNRGAKWVQEEGRTLVETRDRKLRPIGEAEVAMEGAERSWRSLPKLADERHVSAEYSALSSLARMGQLAPEPSVVLVHTSTFDGELAARLVALQLSRDFKATVRRVPISGMDVASRSELRRSLGSFLHEVARALREGDPSSTVFAPLGGYKVMTSLGYLVGAYCGYSAIYLHEVGQTLHTMPWVPIRFDDAVLRELAPLARRARRYLSWESLGHHEREQIEKHGWLFERETVDGAELVALNAFGEFLAREEQYRSLFRTRVWVAEEEEETLREHIDAVRRDVGHLIDWLPYENTERRGEMHHEVSFGHRDTRYALYKHGRSALRMAWRYDADEDALFLRRVWADHDRYQREAESRDVLNAEPRGWEEVTEVVDA